MEAGDFTGTSGGKLDVEGFAGTAAAAILPGSAGASVEVAGLAGSGGASDVVLRAVPGIWEVADGIAAAGDVFTSATGGGEFDANPFSATKAASAEVIGASNEVPLRSGVEVLAASVGRGASGGVARSVTASRCEADWFFALVKGGAARRSKADLEGSGAGEATTAGAAAVRPGMAGGGVSWAVGASPGAGAFDFEAAGLGGRVGAAKEVVRFPGITAGGGATAPVPVAGLAGAPVSGFEAGGGVASPFPVPGDGKRPVRGFTSWPEEVAFA